MHRRKLIDNVPAHPTVKNMPMELRPRSPFNSAHPICGVRTRSGTPCKNAAMDNGRCRMHKGRNVNDKRKERIEKSEKERAEKLVATRKRNKEEKQAVLMDKPSMGVYADIGLLAEEEPVYKKVVDLLGTLDEEISMLRIKLRRAYRAQRVWEEVKKEISKQNTAELAISVALEHGILEINEVHNETGQLIDKEGSLRDIAKSKIQRKIEDYTDVILSTTRLISSMEERRKLLEEGGTGGADVVRKLAEDLRAFGINTVTATLGVDFGGYQRSSLDHQRELCLDRQQEDGMQIEE